MSTRGAMRSRILFCLVISTAALASAADVSHPPLRVAPPPTKRPLATGAVYFVDAKQGRDENAGSREAPWKTIRHATSRLKAGETLYLRGGVFYEQVYVALAGRPDAPITIASYPGEAAILDGGWAEFFQSPQDAWEPVAGGAEHEYRSRRTFPNIRDVVGSFGDSMIGLQTYYHGIDLRAKGELFDWPDAAKTNDTDIAPLYVGPGVWYDRATGHIHARLAHTNLPAPVANYRGPTDPRQVPLVLAPFDSVPLKIDGAKHVRFHDLTLRGAGYHTILVDHGTDLEFDNCTVWCGTYGLHAMCLVGLKVNRCGFYGSVAPWTFRSDASKRDYPGRPHRNISRLNTHAIVAIDSGRESSVFATPQNDRWEFSHCDFTDAHDGVYLGSIHCQFHHNLLENFQDDGIYLSPMYMRHRLDNKDPEIHVYQNVFRGVLTALAFGGTEAVTRDRVSIYRNVFDLRLPVATGRGTTQKPTLSFATGKLVGDHGSPPWSAMNIYHNTVIQVEAGRDAAMASLGSTRDGHARRVFNNIFFHAARLPGFVSPNAEQNSVEDGNLYWSPTADPKQVAALFTKYRASDAFTASKKIYEPGSTAHSLFGDPAFMAFSAESRAANDYRLQRGSAAIGRGIVLPADFVDPARPATNAAPDIGAIPFGGTMPTVGRGG